MATLKGRKYYGIVSKKFLGNSEYINWCSGDIEKAKRGLDDEEDLLVEMEVVKIYTKERDIKEIDI